MGQRAELHVTEELVHARLVGADYLFQAHLGNSDDDHVLLLVALDVRLVGGRLQEEKARYWDALIGELPLDDELGQEPVSPLDRFPQPVGGLGLTRSHEGTHRGVGGALYQLRLGGGVQGRKKPF